MRLHAELRDYLNEEFVLATADTPDSQAEAQKTEQPVEQNIDAPEATAAPEMAVVEEATSPEVKTEEVVTLAIGSDARACTNIGSVGAEHRCE